jgi:hypothetical protein
MNWMDNHIAQVSWWLEFLGQALPVVLTVAVIFTFFIVQSFSRKLERMGFYLDRIDNHLSEITYLLKKREKTETADTPEGSGDPNRLGKGKD